MKKLIVGAVAAFAVAGVAYASAPSSVVGAIDFCCNVLMACCGSGGCC